MASGSALQKWSLPILSLLLSGVLLFVAHFLYPLVCRRDVYSLSDLADHPNLVAFHGYIVDLSGELNSAQLRNISKLYPSSDISSLFPRHWWLARDSELGKYSDRDISTCVSDPLLADAWLTEFAIHERLEGRNSQNNTIDPKAPIDATKACLHPQASKVKRPPDHVRQPASHLVACLSDSTALKEIYSRIVGDLLYDNEVKLQVPIFIDSLVLDVAKYLEYATAKPSTVLLEAINKKYLPPIPREGDTMFLPLEITHPLIQEYEVQLRSSSDYHTHRISIDSKNSFRKDTQWKGFESILSSLPPDAQAAYRRCLLKLFYHAKRPSALSRICLSYNWIFLIVACVSTVFIIVEAGCAYANSHRGGRSWCPPLLRYYQNLTPGWSRCAVSSGNKFNALESKPMKKASLRLSAPILSNLVDDDPRTFAASNHAAVSSSAGPVLFFVPFFAEPQHVIERCLTSVVQCSVANKVLIIVCDGAVQAKGQLSETCRAVLSHLRWRPAPLRPDPPPALPYAAIGQGHKALNYAKIYFGARTTSDGNTVPYVVICKVGTPAEQRLCALPGNRGKRDSMFFVLRFLRSVLVSLRVGVSSDAIRLPPLEAALHQVLTQAGVELCRCEYLLTVDGDVTIAPRGPAVLISELAAPRHHSLSPSELEESGKLCYCPGVMAACGQVMPEQSFKSMWSCFAAYHQYVASHSRPSTTMALAGSLPMLSSPGYAAYRVQTRPIAPIRYDRRTERAQASDDVLSACSSDWHLCIINENLLTQLGNPILISSFEQNLWMNGEDIALTTYMQRALLSRSAPLSAPQEAFEGETELKTKHEEWVCPKMVYVPNAHAWTVVPSHWRIVVGWLTRHWQSHVFVTLDRVWAPPSRTQDQSYLQYVAARSIDICSLFYCLLQPSVAFIFLCTVVITAISPFTFYWISLTIWACAFLVRMMLLILAAKLHMVPLLIVHLLLGHLVHHVLVPILGLATAIYPRWTDHWPAERIDGNSRNAGSLCDPQLENVPLCDQSAASSGNPNYFLANDQWADETPCSNYHRATLTSHGQMVSESSQPRFGHLREQETPPLIVRTLPAPEARDPFTQVEEQETPEGILGMRTSTFCTLAARKLQELFGNVLERPRPFNPTEIQDMVDKIAEDLALHSRYGDRVYLLTHVIEREVVRIITASSA